MNDLTIALGYALQTLNKDKQEEKKDTHINKIPFPHLLQELLDLKETKKMQKFKAGDKVRIIGYGHPLFYCKEGYKKAYEEDKPDNILKEDESFWWVDMKPELVGKEGIVKGSYEDLYGTRHIEAREKPKPVYSIYGIEGKSSWYNEEQLELIK